MKVFFSIISHGHDELIIGNRAILEHENDDVFFIIKDNLNSGKLKNYCDSNKVNYITSEKKLGFGENNNFVFRHCTDLGMDKNDWFVTLNPDVLISVEQIDKLYKELQSSSSLLLTVNLFSDEALTKHENSLRHFPRKRDFLKLFLMRPITTIYDKNFVKNGSMVDWASGAFLIFRSSFYDRLDGFNPKYFMYYEDVDICFRAREEFGIGVVFLAEIKAFHEGGYQNRNVFSKHFLWYLGSLIRFLFLK